MDRQEYERGLGLFNRGEFYEAHEVLEDVWRPCRSEERRFLQGVIQVAVALHHHSTGNHVGAASLLARALRNLDAYPEAYLGLDLGGFRQACRRWGEALANGGPLPPPPQLLPAGGRVLES
jgi:uncharacterized protein